MAGISPLHIGIMILSNDFKLIGMNNYAKKILQISDDNLGKHIFWYHSKKSQSRIKFLLNRVYDDNPDIPVAMIVDVLNKVLMLNLGKINIMDKNIGNIYSMNFIDVSQQAGAEIDPDSGRIVIKKIPIFYKNTIKFVEKSNIFCLEADGNYTKIYVKNKIHYIHSSLKDIIRRFSMRELIRIHKSFAVNLEHIKEIKNLGNGQNRILFDDDSIRPIPVSRRKIKWLKGILSIE